MAERRMFAKSIVDSDAFLELPAKSQLLYFHLAMRADDEGFVNKAKTVSRTCGCNEEDLQRLVKEQYLIQFDGGLVVIRHWKIHNWIRGDRLRPTVYTAQKAALVLDESGAYTLCQTSDRQVTDNCQTQDRLGKDRLGKDSIEGEQKRKRSVPPTLQEVKDYCSERKNNVDAERFFDYYSANGWVQGKGKPIKDWKACIRTWERGNGFATTVKKPKESISEHWEKVESRAMPTAAEIEFFKKQAEAKK